ncbi:MAG: hypothetical protein AMXMBFR13_30160 [Phycisphaerae bacterium]
MGGGGQTPADQGFVLGYAPFPPLGSNGMVQSAAGGLTTLNTSAQRGDSAGYFSYFPVVPLVPYAGQHPNMPVVLDHAAGFSVDFTLRVLSEGHNSPRDDNGDGVDDRAGFSVIVITQDLKGIELGFWADQVWAYDDDSVAANRMFTHAESSDGFDPSGALHSYSLAIQDDGYTLWANGWPVLGGSLRDYTNQSVPVFNPYTQPNFLFFGDDTTSADSVVQIGYIAVAVPEPGVLAGLGLGMICLRRRRYE